MRISTKASKSGSFQIRLDCTETIVVITDDKKVAVVLCKDGQDEAVLVRKAKEMISRG